MDPCESPNLYTVYENCSRVLYMTQKAPLSIALPLYGYVAPTVTALTFITNTFVVVVLSHHNHLRCPTNFILLAMAVTELLTGLSSLPWSLYFYTFGGYGYYMRYGLPKYWCVYFQYISEVLPTMFHTSAVWLTVYLALQRYMQVVRGSRNKTVYLTTLSASKVAVAAICTCATVVQIPNVLASYRSSNVALAPTPNGTAMAYSFCIVNYAGWVGYVGRDAFYNFYYWFIAICVHFVPCLLLLIFTGLLIRFIGQANRRRRRTLFAKEIEFPAFDNSSASLASTIANRRSNRSLHSTTRMLVVVMLIFLFIEIPAAVVYFIYIMMMNFGIFSDSQKEAYYAFNVIFICRNVSILVSYPINFAVYCGMSQQFRSTVRRLFTRDGIRQPMVKNRLGQVASKSNIYAEIPLSCSGSRRPSRLMVAERRATRVSLGV